MAISLKSVTELPTSLSPLKQEHDKLNRMKTIFFSSVEVETHFEKCVFDLKGWDNFLVTALWLSLA